MVERVVKRTMGIQDNSQNTYRRDTVLTSIWERGRQLSRLRSDSQATRWMVMMKEKTTRPYVYNLT